MIKFLVGIFLCGISVPGFAEGLDSGDTAWILTSTALVLFMTIPGLSLFLCWFSQIEKCVKRLNAVFYDLLSDVDLVVSSWLFVSLRRWR